MNSRAVTTFSNYATSHCRAASATTSSTFTRSRWPGVTTINVRGGDPTASDELVVNGTRAANSIAFAPSAAAAGSV